MDILYCKEKSRQVSFIKTCQAVIRRMLRLVPDELKMRLDLKMSPGSFQAHAFSKRQKQYEDHYMGVIKNCFMTVLFLTCVKRSPSKMLPLTLLPNVASVLLDIRVLEVLLRN